MGNASSHALSVPVAGFPCLRPGRRRAPGPPDRRRRPGRGGRDGPPAPPCLRRAEAAGLPSVRAADRGSAREPGPELRRAPASGIPQAARACRAVRRSWRLSSGPACAASTGSAPGAKNARAPGLSRSIMSTAPAMARWSPPMAARSKCLSTPRQFWKSRWPKGPGSAGKASIAIWSRARWGRRHPRAREARGTSSSAPWQPSPSEPSPPRQPELLSTHSLVAMPFSRRNRGGKII